MSCLNSIKNTVTCTELVQIGQTGRINFDFPKNSKMTINFKLLKVSKMTSLKINIISSHGEARNIKFGQQVCLIQKVPLGTPPQEVLMSSLVTGATVIKNLGSKNNSLIEVHRDFFVKGSNVITFSSCEIDKSLNLQL